MLFAQEMSMPAPPPPPLHVPFIVPAALGLLVLLAFAFVLWCLIRANVARAFARILAVLAIGAGVGVLTWGICALALDMQIRSPFGLVYLMSDPVEAIGWGAGLLAAGITGLVLSLVRKREGKMPIPPL